MVIQNRPRKKKVRSIKPKICCPEKLGPVNDNSSMINRKMGRFLFTPTDFTKNVIIDNSAAREPISLG